MGYWISIGGVHTEAVATALVDRYIWFILWRAYGGHD